MLIKDIDFQISWDIHAKEIYYHVGLFRGLPKEELLQESRICLMNCMRTYNSVYSSFSTYFSRQLFFRLHAYCKRQRTRIIPTEATDHTVISQRYVVLDFLRFYKTTGRKLRAFKVFYRLNVLGQRCIDIQKIYKLSHSAIYKDANTIKEYIKSYNL